MADNEFDGLDRLIEDSLDNLPPDDIVDHVSAGKTAFDLIIAGLALSTITLNFLALNYILPMIGIVLLLLGLRRLRGENGWFMVCFVISAVRCVSVAAQCIVSSTIYNDIFTNSGAADATGWVNIALVFALIICLRRGILATQRRAQLEPHAGGATALIIWYAVVCALALASFDGLILVIGLIIGFILILRSLARLARELIDASYAVRSAPVRISDRALCVSIFALVIAGVICGYAFFRQLPMQWQPEQETQTSELRRELLNAGYPEAALRDLSDEDIALCEGFAAVSSDTETQELDKQQGGGKLTFTTVAVKLDRDGEHWRIFTHFEWSGADFRGTELIRIIPGYMRDGARLGWGPDGEITGRLLYDTDGRTVTAPYYSLIDSHSSYTDPFFGMTESLGILGSFSMPSQSEHQRGYVAYGTAIPANALDHSTEEYDVFALTSVAGFTHQYSIWQFPVKTAESVVRSGSVSFSECFANLWFIFLETH